MKGRQTARGKRMQGGYVEVRIEEKNVREQHNVFVCEASRVWVALHTFVFASPLAVSSHL